MVRISLLFGVIFLLMIACTTSPSQGPSHSMETEVARQLTALVLGSPTSTPAGISETQPAQLPSVTPTQSPLPSATATITPTITPPLTDPRLTLGNPDWKEEFSDSHEWFLYDDDLHRFEILDHKFVMTAKQANAYDGWTLTGFKLTNYYIELTATTGTCSGRDRYGFVLGASAPSENLGYLFGFSCDGMYSFRYWDNDKYHFLKEWTKSSSILTGAGQTNRMGFKAKGGKLSFYANGQFLSEIEAPDFGEGRFGLFIGSVNTVNFEVRVSEVAFWELD